MSTAPTAADRPRAVLAAVRLPGVPDVSHEASFQELRRLVETLGYEVVGRVSQGRQKLSSAAVFGKGKLKDLAEWTGGTGVVLRGPRKKAKDEDEDEDEDEEIVELEDDEDDESGDAPPEGKRADVIIVDHELTPQQLRNLETATGAEVLDRTGVIVEIFHRHASSREAKLQVEIARLTYLAPRLRETGGQRQRGGIGQKGAGESAIELDRRKIRDRIAELKDELEAIEGEAHTRRARRQESLRVALVGYTNAGKSSLMRALTGSEVYVADKLFATLDTTVRALWPDSRPRVLVSDTVGFIKKLPHDLVASFRSTLDEALEASLLLHVVDAADPDWRSQRDVTREVLHDIGADDVPSLLVLNKADKLDAAAIDALREEFPDALIVSAKQTGDVRAVRDAIVAAFEDKMVEEDLLLPYSAQHLVGEVHKLRILTEEYAEDGGHFRVLAPKAAIDRLRSKIGKDNG